MYLGFFYVAKKFFALLFAIFFFLSGIFGLLYYKKIIYFPEKNIGMQVSCEQGQLKIPFWKTLEFNLGKDRKCKIEAEDIQNKNSFQ